MRLPLFFLLAALLVLPAFGQEKTASGAKYISASNGKTSALIQEILVESLQLKSKENKIIIWTLMTGALWSQNEKRARVLIRETAEKIRSELAPDDQALSITQFPPMQYSRLRHDFLLAVVKHDPALAREMAIYTTPLMPKFPPTTQSEHNQLRYWRNEERDLEQKMAFLAAAQDLEAARKMASESLARGVTNESLNTLRRFQIKDAAAADSFAGELMQKLLAADFAKDEAAQETAAFLLAQLDEKNGVFAMPRSCSCPAKPLNPDLQKTRKLAAKWLDYAATANDETISFHFLPVIPLLQKLLPEKNSVILAKFDAIREKQPKRLAAEQIREQVADDKTEPEAIAAQGVGKPAREKFHFYRQAFIKAANKSKAALEKLLAAVSEHPESEEKKWLIDEINANLSGKTAEDGDLDRAYEMSQKVVKRDRRIGLLSFLALEYLKKGDAAKAKQLSDEIAAVLDIKNKDKMPKAVVGYDVFSTIFRTFALVDTEYAFILLEYALPEASGYFAGNFARSNVDASIDVKTVLKRNAYALSMYATPLKNLVEKDFDRAKNLASYFKEPELSVLAKVLLAQSATTGSLGFGNFADRNEMIVLKD